MISATITDELVAKLIVKQNGQSNAKFAKTLGVSRATWSMVRRGKLIPDTRKFIPAVMRAFPDLIPICLTIQTTAPEKE